MANDTAARLLARFRKLREARGLTQEKFAELAGMKYKHYQSAEAGRKPKIQLPTLIKMAEALELKLCELVDLDASIPVAAEKQAKLRNNAVPRKGAAKSPKRRAGRKDA